MSSYISSNANRFYAALETTYGQAAPIMPANRYSAIHLRAHQSIQPTKRFDKTGTRTFQGNSPNGRRQTAFLTQVYLTSWDRSSAPSYGPLFQAALGRPPVLTSELTITSTQGLTEFQTSTEHALSFGTGVGYGGEIRFVATVTDSHTFSVNAPFKTLPEPGNCFSACLNYTLATELPSLTIYDYWDPIATVSRIVTGCAVDTLNISINGDFHEFTFSGPAADLVDSSSFTPGVAGLTSYPTEPQLQACDYSIVPGHLGEVWLGGPASQFFTLTEASVEMKNNIVMRTRDYGSSYARGISPGERRVALNFSLLTQDDAQTVALYAAAKQRNPIPVMLQLGQRPGQIMGIFMQQVVPEIPVYDDSQPRLQWQFNNNLAQGVSNDEIFIAFG
jgi:hypothetical protein